MTSDLAAVFKQERLKRNMSQNDVAQALGITVSHVSKIESGDRSPSLELAEDFVKLFGLQIVLRRDKNKVDRDKEITERMKEAEKNFTLKKP